MIHLCFPCRAGLLACALTCLAAPAVFSTPVSIIITAPAGSSASAGLPAALAEWKMSGACSAAYLLKESGDGSGGKGATLLAALEFPDASAADRWRANKGSSLGGDAAVTRAIPLAHDEVQRDSTQTAFVVSEYAVAGGPEACRDCVQGRIAPALEALKGKHLVMSFSVYGAEPGGKAGWQALVVTEYRDASALKQAGAALDAGDSGKALGSRRASWLVLPAPELAGIPAYVVEYKVAATIRIGGSPLRGSMVPLETAFLRFHPSAQFANNFAINSEGSIGALCTGLGEIATNGDDAKISDRMPFFFVNNYLPQEFSVATGAYEARGGLWPAAILVHRDNPIARVTMDELDRIFGAERTGAWDVGNNPAHNILFSGEFARGPESNIRKWGQLGVTGQFADKEIQTYGYVAPGFATYFQRKVLHWSTKYNPNFREFIMDKQAEDGANGAAVVSDRLWDQLVKDRYGMAWGAMYEAKHYPEVKALAVAPGKTDRYVPYTPENVVNRTYPLIRDAYVYLNHAPGVALDPKVREFMRFMLSREGQQIMAGVGYFPLTPEESASQARKLDAKY